MRQGGAASLASRTLLSEARDIGAEVTGFLAAELHVGHLGVGIHQKMAPTFSALNPGVLAIEAKAGASSAPRV